MSGHRDAAVDRARNRRAELISELEQIDIFLALYQKYSELPDGDRAEGGMVADSDRTVPVVLHQGTGSFHASGSLSANAEVVSPPPKGMRQPEFVGFVRTLLLENGAPMSAPDIIKRFRDKGRHVGGADESSNLKTKLWRAKEQITIVPGAGYWPIDVPCEAVSYNPQIREDAQ